jgi:ADP-ribosylglycohydrolase
MQDRNLPVDSQAARKDRIIGSILGGAIGDCLGGPYEGKPAPATLNNRAYLRISDDTILTLATCEAIIERGSADPAAIAERLGALYRSGGLEGAGAATMKAARELAHGGHWALVGRKGAMAAGNGAAMRIAPVAFCLEPRDLSHRRTIRDICRITHHNEEAYAGALAVAISIRSAWDGFLPGQGSGLFELLLEHLPDTSVRDRIAEIAEAGDDLPLAAAGKMFGSSGYVVESVPLAIVGASRMSRLGFMRVLEDLVMIGGDTDTIASMAGQIMGCALGRAGIPQEQAVQLPSYDRLVEVASKFADVTTRMIDGMI